MKFITIRLGEKQHIVAQQQVGRPNVYNQIAKCLSESTAMNIAAILCAQEMPVDANDNDKLMVVKP
jgi:hypothetical protein